MPIRVISAEREKQIKELVAKGKKPKQISDLLGLKLTTTLNHIKKYNGYKPRTVIKHDHKEVHKNGIFNENARGNWLI